MKIRPAVLFVRYFPPEAAVWAIGLFILAMSDPLPDHHVTICPLALFGVEWCPGCGLGRSISFLFRGEWQQSFASHPLGLPAIAVLTYRIIQLIKNHIKYGKDHRFHSGING
jgi:hypothetical protein